MHRLILKHSQASPQGPPGGAPNGASEYPLDQDELIIGREVGVQVHIPQPAISRRHARLVRSGEQYWIEDLGSSNGTFVNEQRLQGRQALQHGDEIRLGSTVRLSYENSLPAAAQPYNQPPARTPQPPAAYAQPPLVGPSGTVRVPGQASPAPPGAPAAAPPQADLPRLVIQVGQRPAQVVSLDRPTLSLGRAADNDIVIDSKLVSRRHARLELGPQGYQFVPLAGAGNPFTLNGQRLAAPYPLQPGDILRLDGPDPAYSVALRYESIAVRAAIPFTGAPGPALAPPAPVVQSPPPGLRPAAPAPTRAAGPGSPPPARTQQIDLTNRTRLTLGRDPGNDIVLEAPTISRFHAHIEKVGERYRLRDLDSANGTYVNDRPVQGEVWLNPQDTVRLGPYRLRIGQDRIDRFDETGGMRIDAVGLNKWVRKDLNLLQDISLTIQPQEFVVVVGQSGGGKTTLVDSLAGYRPATHGQVFVNGVNIAENFDALRSEIGYVPQRDIIHMELSVYQALDYAARLRMPRDTSREERRKRVLEVLHDLDLEHRADIQISRLSGGQQKRVSIGVELLTKPGLFFLDEPTSGLDPGGETSLMQLMRKLADQGRTVVLITHATKNVMLADKVVFLARGGYLAWFGPPDEALRYFDQYRTPAEQHQGEMQFDQIYALLDDAQRGSPTDWSERFQRHQAYQQYILQPLAQAGRLEGVYTRTSIQRLAGGAPQVIARPTPRQPKRRTTNLLDQFIILSSRNLRILVRDRFSLLLMLAVAPLTGLLSFVLSSAIGRNPYDYVNGNFPGVAISLFTLPIFGVLVGCLAEMREFVKEADIYKRERLVNLRILPYVLSKIWVALLLALYQALAYVAIHYLAFDVPGGWAEFGLIYVTAVLGVLSGMMLGLLASALAPNANAAPLVMILFMIPQIVLAGALVKLPGAVTAFTSTRWAYEAILSVSGAGSDVIRDPCWALTKQTRQLMSNDDKAAAGCNCSGMNALHQATCQFPGVGQFYDPAIDQPPPTAPEKPGAPPPEPVFPNPPAEPTNPGDPAATAAYLQALKAYNAQVTTIRNDYNVTLQRYQALIDQYQGQVIAYEKSNASWQIARNAAVSKAESLIEPMYRDHGWAFADKEDSLAYWAKLARAWIAQGIIMLVSFIAILLLIKRKDYTA